jgi:hypothetical protein
MPTGNHPGTGNSRCHESLATAPGAFYAAGFKRQVGLKVEPSLAADNGFSPGENCLNAQSCQPGEDSPMKTECSPEKYDHLDKSPNLLTWAKCRLVATIFSQRCKD